MSAPRGESQDPRGAAREILAAESGRAASEETRMAEMGPRSIANIVFIVLLAAALGFGVLATVRMIGAAFGGGY